MTRRTRFTIAVALIAYFAGETRAQGPPARAYLNTPVNQLPFSVDLLGGNGTTAAESELSLPNDENGLSSTGTNAPATPWPNATMEDHIRPSALRAGIRKRVAWHVFRHSYGTLLKSSGQDVKTTKELMRHTNASITMDTYVQPETFAKHKAHC